MPCGLVRAFERAGIRSLFPWQVECLDNPRVLAGARNLLYFAPTSAGKSLVAELLMLRGVLKQGRRALYILPFVAIVQEKTAQLKALYSEVNVRVEALYSGSEVTVWSPLIDICVCTIEKGAAIATQLFGDPATARFLSLFVFDEFHLISDASRGHTLETLVLKLQLAARRYPGYAPQIVAMSATLSAPERLADWLEADTFQGESRPAPLHEYFKIGKQLFTKDMQTRVTLNLQSESPLGPLPAKCKPAHGELAALSSFYLARGKPVIIFCATKQECVTVALSLADLLPRQFDLSAGTQFSTFLEEYEKGRGGEVGTPFSKVKVLDEAGVAQRQALLKALGETPARLCGVLRRTVPLGVAYHNADLSLEERVLVEEAYRAKTLLVLCATSTLSTGVNLPTKAVIFQRPRIGQHFIDFAHYKQMAGRAGRTGFDSSGDAIMLCTIDEKRKLDAMLAPGLDRPLLSALQPLHLCAALLETLNLGFVRDEPALQTFLRSTLLFTLAAPPHEPCSICRGGRRSPWTNEIPAKGI